MRNKYLIPFLTSSILAFSIFPVWGQENATPEITFACEDSNSDIPITVARNKAGKTETIFYWKKEVLIYTAQSTPQELCHDVSEKLTDLFIKNYISYSFFLIPTEHYGLPTICAELEFRKCTKVLFILKSTESATLVAENILIEIINLNISKVDLRYSDRLPHGRYEINLFKNDK